jgi:hypothetical protein
MLRAWLAGSSRSGHLRLPSREQDRGILSTAKAGVAFDDELERRIGTALPERTVRQFASTLSRLRIAGRRLGMEESA